jgi:hypothetical protein
MSRSVFIVLFDLNSLVAMKGDLKIRGYTVGQFPNAPLIFGLVGLLASWILSSGSTAYGVARAVFYIGVAVWAWLELSDGVNGFRRILGAAGLLFVLVSLSDDLG